MSPTITINPGAGVDIPPGVYPVVLVNLAGPRVIIPQSGPNIGQEVEILDWQFAIDEGDLDGTIIDATTSTRSGPKSKLFSWLTALLGGQSPAIGTTFEAEDLKGRRALATVGMNDAGWPKVEALTAIPVAYVNRAPAPRQTAPVQTVPAQRQPAATAQRTSVSQAPAVRGVQQPVAAPASNEQPF